jgi:hypothetical protein
MTMLLENDIAFVRRGLSLDKMLTKHPEKEARIVAKVVRWNDASDMLAYLKNAPK